MLSKGATNGAVAAGTAVLSPTRDEENVNTKPAAANATAGLLTGCHTGLTLRRVRLREPRQQEREPPRPWVQRLSGRHGGCSIRVFRRHRTPHIASPRLTAASPSHPPAQPRPLPSRAALQPRHVKFIAVTSGSSQHGIFFAARQVLRNTSGSLLRYVRHDHVRDSAMTLCMVA